MPLFVLLCIVVCVAENLFSKNIPVISEMPVIKLDLENSLEILEDKERKLTIEYILEHENTLAFLKPSRENINYGYSRSIYWVRFTLQNNSEIPREFTLVYNYPLIGNLDLYAISLVNHEKHRTYLHEEGGLYRPFGLRYYDYRNPNFKLNVKKGLNVYYLKIQTLSPVNINLILYQYNAFVSMINREIFAHGIYFGALLAMLLYNMFMYIVLKERSYLYYILFVFFWLAFSYSHGGYARQYLWPNAPWQMMYSTLTLLGIALFFISLFSIEYLELKKKSGKYYFLFLLLMFLILASTLVLFFSFFLGAKMILLFGFLSFLVYLAVGIYFYLRGNRYTRYFAAGFLVLFFGWIFNGLQEIGLLHGAPNILYGYIGTVGMMAFISLSLTDRYNFMKDQIENSHKKVIQIHRNYSGNLQKQVAEKTRDILNEKNRLEAFVKSMEMELEIARSIREKFVIQKNASDYISYIFQPAADVGGDYLEFFQLDYDHMTGVILCDVGCKGINAMFNILILKTLILEAGKKRGNPNVMISHINDFLKKNSAFGFMTMFYCIFDNQSGEVTYANAGFIPPFIVSKNGSRQISDKKGVVLGIMDSESTENSTSQFETGRVQLQKNEKILLFSNGFLKSLGEEENTSLFQVVELFHELSNLPSLQFMERIQKEIKRNPEKDDVSLVCLEKTE